MAILKETGIKWLDVAAGELGVREIPGTDSNPRIGEYHASTWLTADEPDDTPWCSSFVNYCIAEAGLRGTGSPAARSWRTWGTDGAWAFGDVVGWMTPKGTGHVGFLVGLQARNGSWNDAPVGAVTILGGNQGNEVSVRTYIKRSGPNSWFCVRPIGHWMTGPCGPYRDQFGPVGGSGGSTR